MLVERLKASDHGICVRHEGETGGRSALDLVLDVERRRFGPALLGWREPLPSTEDLAADLVLDLTGMAPAGSLPVLRLQYSGWPRIEDALAGMMASGTAPQIVARLDGAPVGTARPMVSDRLWLTRAGDEMMSGVISLVEQVVARFSAGRLEPVSVPPARSSKAPAFLSAYLPHVTRMAVQRIRNRARLKGRPFYWQTAYRLIEGPGVAESGQLDGAPFAELADDGERFYADPFLFEEGGRVFLFVEEFPYAGGKGIISVSELGADGRFPTPRPVLEEGHHLSYPQVFAHGGQVYMLPEGSGSGRLTLYRAEAFPDRWVADAVLIDGDINDATLLERDGRWWMLGTQKRGRGSASDTLVVYWAPDLHGPWQPHRLNPIAVDRAATRPGGHFIRSGDRIILPVQDGTHVYGGGLGLMELVRLDLEDVAFAPVRPIGTGPAWAREGIHTLNRVGRVEVVDSCG